MYLSDFGFRVLSVLVHKHIPTGICQIASSHNSKYYPWLQFLNRALVAHLFKLLGHFKMVVGQIGCLKVQVVKLQMRNASFNRCASFHYPLPYALSEFPSNFFSPLLTLPVGLTGFVELPIVQLHCGKKRRMVTFFLSLDISAHAAVFFCERGQGGAFSLSPTVGMGSSGKQFFVASQEMQLSIMEIGSFWPGLAEGGRRRRGVA